MLEQFRRDPAAKSIAFYSSGENVAVTDKLIEQLFGVSVEAGHANARICLHQSAEDTFHQMLILEWRGKSFPAHRHPTKSEGYHVLHGRMDVLLYAEDGVLRRRYELSVENPIARVGPQTFHALEIVSTYALYLESKSGPFVRESDKIMAPWIGAPNTMPAT
jgi:cupin fold WbuC family metalloprotein